MKGTRLCITVFTSFTKFFSDPVNEPSTVRNRYVVRFCIRETTVVDQQKARFERNSLSIFQPKAKEIQS